jgi:hypothetical protein
VMCVQRPTTARRRRSEKAPRADGLHRGRARAFFNRRHPQPTGQCLCAQRVCGICGLRIGHGGWGGQVREPACAPRGTRNNAKGASGELGERGRGGSGSGSLWGARWQRLGCAAWCCSGKLLTRRPFGAPPLSVVICDCSSSGRSG